MSKLLFYIFISLNFYTIIRGENNGQTLNETDFNSNNRSVDPNVDHFLPNDSILIDDDIRYYPTARAATKFETRLWPKGIVPHIIDDSFNKEEVDIIMDGIREFHKKTVIKFVPRTNQSNFIHIIPERGCWSYLGMITGRQYLSLSKYGCVKTGFVIHELMHAIGFHHEESRTDRDDFVEILWDNIIDYYKGDEYKGNFVKSGKDLITSLGIGYDYGSIMHSGRRAHSKDPSRLDTIVPRQKDAQIGQRFGLSEKDIMQINLLYLNNNGN